MESKEQQNSYELSKMADEILAKHKCDIWGREANKENFAQAQFEARMLKGAYGRNSEKPRGK